MGNKYVVIITDGFTKNAKICEIPNKKAETTADMVFTKWICRYGCPAIIYTGGRKIIYHEIAAELDSKLEIKGAHTVPADPQCISQAEIFNKTLATYIKNVVNESTLNWKWYLAPSLFCNNTSYHRTINTSPFELTSGMKPRFPSFLTLKLSRINSDKGFVAERLQLLKRQGILLWIKVCKQEMTTKRIMTLKLSYTTWGGFHKKFTPYA